MKVDGANFVRISTDSEYALNAADLNYFEQFAQLAAAQDIYVSYCLRENNNSESQPNVPYYDVGNGYINTPADFESMWGTIASTLGKYSNVLFELWNEPQDYTSTLGPIFQACINDIRSTGATNCIIVEFGAGVYYDFGPGGSDSDMSWVGDGVNYSSTLYQPMNLNDPDGNLIYSTHIYLNGNFFSSSNGYLTDYSTSDFNYAMEMTGVFAVAAVHPLLIGEIGDDLYDTGNAAAQLNWYEYAVNLFLSNGIGVCNWWWYPPGTEYSTLTGGANFALNAVGTATANIFLASPQSVVSQQT